MLMSAMQQKVAAAFSRLKSDRKGVGAVEFALIAPVLIVLYIGSLEISVAMSVNKKVARASSTIADLITQETEIDKTYLKTMVNVGESVLAPFNSSGLKMEVTGIKVDGSGVARAAWSWNQSGGRPYEVNSVQTVPKDLAIPNSFLVRTKVNVDYTLVLVPPSMDDVDVTKLNMEKTYHLRQRIGDQVTCKNC